MSRRSYTRLSAQDHSFLVAERRSTPMHVGAIRIYEAGPLRRRGLNADYDLLPDLRLFVRATDVSFRELCQVAGVKPSEQPGAGASVISLRTGHPA